jgi:hypothetical protein
VREREEDRQRGGERGRQRERRRERNREKDCNATVLETFNNSSNQILFVTTAKYNKMWTLPGNAYYRPFIRNGDKKI